MALPRRDRPPQEQTQGPMAPGAQPRPERRVGPTDIKYQPRGNYDHGHPGKPPPDYKPPRERRR